MQYQLDPKTSTWNKKIWNGISNIGGNDIWTDGTNIYHSDGSTRQYQLNKNTSTWTTKTWNGFTSFYGSNVWTDGTNIYSSTGTYQYQLDKSTSTWNPKTWNGLTEVYGRNIWTDGENIYVSNDNQHYQLDKSTSTWNSKTWYQPFELSEGCNVWTDGTNTYYSSGTQQYQLDKSAVRVWNNKNWTGLTSFSGFNVWTDGTNIYYSDAQTNGHYQLDKTTSTWSAKTWSGWKIFSGQYVWTDGTNIYYSYSTSGSSGSSVIQYKLDKPTSTWTKITWNDNWFQNNAQGDNVWTDGTNTYYSESFSHYKFNKTNSTWETITWNSESLWYMDGKNVWTDGKEVYYLGERDGLSVLRYKYKLNRSTNMWETMEWDGLTFPDVYAGINGNVWVVDTNIYCSPSIVSTQYQLYPPIPIHYCYKGDTCQWVKPYTITIKVTGTPNANIKVIIYRSSNAKGQEPSAVYDSSGGESSYVINVASTAADGQQIVGYYGDTLYVKAQSYSSGSDSYNISGHSYTVTGDDQLIVFVGHSVSCSSCNTSARKVVCGIRCRTSIAQITLCSNTSADSSKCLL